MAVIGAILAAGTGFGATPQAHAAEPPAATAPTIPVDIISAVDGGYLPTVEVSINGSTPVRMMIDEGTSFLVTFPGSIIDPTTPIDQTGIPQSIQYDGTAASGQIGLATVTVTTTTGSVSTPQPTAFLDASSCTPQCLGYKDDIQGVIGISQSKDATKNIEPVDGIYSVLAQLGQPLSSGYTIDFTSSQPNIQLGEPTPGSAGDTSIQRADQDGLTYPNGQSIFKPPVICWSISLGSAAGTKCENTVLDTGQSSGILNGDVFDPVVTPLSPPPSNGAIARVADGAVIGFSTSKTAIPFARLVSTAMVPHLYNQFTVKPNKAVANYFNAGNDFYLSHVIGFDNQAGAVIIHAAVGAPAPTPGVNAAAGDGTIFVAWARPAGGGPKRVGYLVTIRTADGAMVSTTTVGADATEATIGGLTNGTPYDVAVATINELTIGPDASVPGTITPEGPVSTGTPTPSPGAGGSSTTSGVPDPDASARATGALAATGSDVPPELILAAGLVALGVAVLAIRAGGRRTKPLRREASVGE
ncbi:hypothetical protein GCM10027568_14750 [Humibacter soli]